MQITQNTQGITELCSEIVKAEKDNKPESFEIFQQKLGELLAEQVVKALEFARTTGEKNIRFIASIGWRPMDNGWKLFNIIEQELAKLGEIAPIACFERSTIFRKEGEEETEHNVYELHFTFKFGDCFSPDETPLLGDDLEEKSQEFEKWAKEVAHWLCFQRPITQKTIIKQIPFKTYNAAIYYALIKAIREIDDGMRLSFWKVHPERREIMISLA